MTFAARHLLPLLSIDLNDAGEGGGSGGGGGEAGGEAGEGDKAAAPAGDSKAAPGDPGAPADKTPAKGGDDKASAEKAAKEARAALGKSYEKWEPKLPKGMPFDAKGFGDFRETFAELGLKPEQAQKLVDVFAKGELGRMQAVAAELKRDEESWANSLKADKELAGENGEKLEASQKAASRAMGKLATPAFRKLLEDSRLSRHPEMIRIMARAGAGMAEDSTSSSKAGNKSANQTPAQKAKSRWPNSPELHNPS